ncbi:hypothetical protein [Pollutibacter soli]|uniref:hypothetical protein n=1 Tax=Pollutibacter soli TaxID=3034157 RepID=UPI0030140C7E
MDLKLSRGFKISLTIICFGIAIVGFILKLPSQFRHYDKELHAAFYFLAAAFLNILFAGRKLWKHILVFGFLYLFGIAIEYGQEYSKKKFHIAHGRFDPEDVQSNLYGLIAFSAVWVVFALIALVVKGSVNDGRTEKANPEK